MFTTLTRTSSRRTALIGAASIAGALAVFGVPGLVSAADHPAAPPTLPPIIVNPTNPPIPTIPPIIVNPTNPPIPTIPPIIVNPTFPEPTNPDDFTNPTFPEPTNPDDFTNPTFPEPTDPDDFTNPTFPEPTDPDDLTNPDPDQGGNPESDPADPASAAPQAAPAGQLPATGVDSSTLAVLAVTLTAGGVAIATLARRKPDAA